MEVKTQLLTVLTFVGWGLVYGVQFSQMIFGAGMTWLTLVIMLAFWMAGSFLNFDSDTPA